jgi:predicted MFS family arabinose efflux permease
MTTNETRINEWFVPKFGPIRFRVFVGLLFLPYTGMCVSFTIISSMLAGEIAWDRVGAIALIYALALGVSAHVADSLGSKKTKPWGSYFTRAQLLALMAATLAAAYAIGIYYIVFFVPLLAVIAALEGSLPQQFLVCRVVGSPAGSGRVRHAGRFDKHSGIGRFRPDRACQLCRDQDVPALQAVEAERRRPRAGKEA